MLVTWFVASRAGLGMTEFRALELSGWTPNWLLIALSAVLLLSGYFSTGYLWSRIVRDLGGAPLPLFLSVRLFMIANLGRYVPGKVWQIAGLAMLAREVGVGASTATAAAILGQGIALVAATLIGLGAVWTLAEGTIWQWLVPIVLFGAVLTGLVPPVFRSVSALWFRLARTEAPPGLSPSTAVQWLGIGIGSWLIYSGAFWVLVRGLGFEVPLISTASSFGAAYVLGYIMIFAPAGIGVREGFLVALMSPQLGPGAAGAVAVIARIWTTVIEVVPAAAFWTRHLTRADGADTHGE